MNSPAIIICLIKIHNIIGYVAGADKLLISLAREMCNEQLQIKLNIKIPAGVVTWYLYNLRSAARSLAILQQKELGSCLFTRRLLRKPSCLLPRRCVCINSAGGWDGVLLVCYISISFTRCFAHVDFDSSHIIACITRALAFYPFISIKHRHRNGFAQYHPNRISFVRQASARARRQHHCADGAAANEHRYTAIPVSRAPSHTYPVVVHSFY